MNRPTRIATAGAALIVATGVTAGIATGIAAASSGDDSEGPITGDALQQASDAALASTGSGKVTDTEVGDEESYYEVEVTLDNGDEVDVQLDKNFRVVGSTTDGPEGTEGDEGADSD